MMILLKREKGSFKPSPKLQNEHVQRNYSITNNTYLCKKYYKYTRCYHPLISIACSAAATWASCFDDPVPSATISSPKNTPTRNVFE